MSKKTPPKTPPPSLKHRLYRIEIRRKRATAIFVQLCRDLRLSKILGKRSAWAIVGGAVRDCLLSDDPYTEALWSPWPDVDVAVAESGFDLETRLAGLEDIRLKISRNTFGGWRACSPSTGEVDIWRVTHEKTGPFSAADWLSYLETIDFVPNAVAFIWPQMEIILHPRWITSLLKKEVDLLSTNSPRSELQSVRAVALAAKLYRITGLNFRLSPRVHMALKSAMQDVRTGAGREAFHYLRKKVVSGRWPRSVLSYLQVELDRENLDQVIRSFIEAEVRGEIDAPRERRCKRKKAPCDVCEFLPFPS